VFIADPSFESEDADGDLLCVMSRQWPSPQEMSWRRAALCLGGRVAWIKLWEK